MSQSYGRNFTNGNNNYISRITDQNHSSNNSKNFPTQQPNNQSNRNNNFSQDHN